MLRSRRCQRRSLQNCQWPAMSYSPKFKQPKRSLDFFSWGGFAPPDPPFKSAAVAASASQVRTLKSSRPLSRPRGGKYLRGTKPGTGREALARPIFLFLTKKNKTGFSYFRRGSATPPPSRKMPDVFLFGGGQIQDWHFWLRRK